MSDLTSLTADFAKSVDAVTQAKTAADKAEVSAQTARTALSDAVEVAKKSRQALHDHVDSVAPDIHR